MSTSKPRPARVEDASAIKQLSACLAYLPVSNEEFASGFEYLLESDIDEVWVVEIENKVVGWIHFFLSHRITSVPFVEIGGLAVATDYRHRGVGKSLVEQARKWAKENHGKLRVRCNSKRIEAQKFYASAGFIESKTQYVYDLN